jgi:phosphatidyl-myo-inositol dimannoside synthase
MKLLLLAENWLPRVGGIENYLQSLTENLAQKHDMKVVVPKIKGTQDKENKSGLSVERHHFFYGWVRPKWLFLYWDFKKRVKREEIDLMLCGKALFEGWLAYRLKEKSGLKYVIFTYGTEIEQWASKWWTRYKLKKVLKEAELVIYINDVTKKKLLELGTREDQLMEVLPGVHDRFCRNLADELILGTVRHYGISQPYILCVSRLVDRKGIGLLIEAFADLDQVNFSDWKLVIVGNGDEKDNLKSQVSDQFAEKSVYFLTDVPDRHLPALYAGAEIFALTPKEIKGDIEGFGMVYQEASASGTAVLGTQTGGVAKAVLNQETGILVEPNSVESIKKGLTQLIEDKDLRNKLGRNGQERSRLEWRWEQRLDTLNKWIKEHVSR